MPSSSAVVRTSLWVSLACFLSACSLVELGAPDPLNQGPTDEGSGGADVARPVYHKDGTVEVGHLRFGTVTAFQVSNEFRDHGRRCGSPAPSTQFAVYAAADCSMTMTSIRPEYQPGAVMTVPVVFHVIQKSDGTGYVSPDLVHSQIDVLNEDYGALPGSNGAAGTDTAIRFVLATTDPSGNPTDGIDYQTNDSWFTDPGPGASNAMKNALSWDSVHYLNVYTNDAAGNLGYATFPQQDAGDKDDGVVLLWNSVGKNAPQGGEYNLGRSATHEIGHYFGLFHTFQGGCGSSSSPYTSADLIADTVGDPSPDFQCTNAASSCGGGNLPVENYMDYSPDACMNRFTAEQANRMRCAALSYRSELYTTDGGGGGGGTNQTPTAEFTSSVSNLKVNFTDHSTDPDGSISSRSWDFGDGHTSSTTNPQHTYASGGSYTVTLTVTDNDGATDSQSHAVSVSEAAAAAAVAVATARWRAACRRPTSAAPAAPS